MRSQTAAVVLCRRPITVRFEAVAAVDGHGCSASPEEVEEDEDGPGKWADGSGGGSAAAAAVEDAVATPPAGGASSTKGAA